MTDEELFDLFCYDGVEEIAGQDLLTLGRQIIEIRDENPEDDGICLSSLEIAQRILRYARQQCEAA